MNHHGRPSTSAASIPRSPAPFQGRQSATRARIENRALKVLCIFIIFEYARPQDYFGISALGLPSLLSLYLLFLWLGYPDKWMLREKTVRITIAFWSLLAVSVIVVVNHYYWYTSIRDIFLYFFAIALPMAAFLNKPEKLRLFFWFWLGAHAFAASVGLINGGRGPGSFLGDENDFAMAMNMAIPYAWFLSQSAHNTRVMRIILYVLAGVLIIASTATVSRGGFVGLVAVLGVIFLFSRHKVRTLMSGTILSVVVVSFLPPEFIDDMRTIDDPNDGTRQERIESWESGWLMFLDNPVIGVGAGNYPWRVEHYQLLRDPDAVGRTRLLTGRQAHSLYFTVLPETGALGTGLYLTAILLVAVKLLKIVRSPPPEDPRDPAGYIQLLGKAMLASLAAYLVCGIFISVLYYPHLWYLIGLTLALERCWLTTTADRPLLADDGTVVGRPRMAGKSAHRKKDMISVL